MPGHLISPVRRVDRAVTQRLKTWRLGRLLTVVPHEDMVTIGTTYGGWSIPADGLGPESVCYLAGLGQDASFDLGVIERFGCTVLAFDPVPEASRYAATVSAREPRFEFRPVGLWSADGTLRFYENAEPGFVSRSATNMHGTGEYTEAQVRAVDSLMAELGHQRVDLLKLRSRDRSTRSSMTSWQSICRWGCCASSSPSRRRSSRCSSGSGRCRRPTCSWWRASCSRPAGS